MRVLFIGSNFPPEVNALATRLYEHARQWVGDGHEIVVMTDVPNFPEGKVYHGYRNRFTKETVGGIRVVRVPFWIAQNEGTVKRTISFVSFMLSIIWYSRQVKGHVDVVAASSPQFFAALAGYAVSKLKKAPFVLEIRDLWPESIVAVGAMRRNRIIRFFERIERFLYRKADHIVVVTDSFKKIIASRGIEASKISVVKNGADLMAYNEAMDEKLLHQLKAAHDLEKKFVVSYIGTIGMAHRVDILFEAARRCAIEDVVFVVVGTGAERKALEEKLREEPLKNFRLIDKQPKAMVRYWLALSDASVVHLKASPLFKTVIPSKIFEAMAMKIPILMGVEGEAQEIVEAARAGLSFKPEQVDALLDAVDRLYVDSARRQSMAENGYAYVCRNHDRIVLAKRYMELLEHVASGTGPRFESVLEFANRSE